MKFLKTLYYGLLLMFAVFSANCYLLVRETPLIIIGAVAAYLAVNILPGFFNPQVPGKRLKICLHGVQCLKLFVVSTAVSIIYHIVLAFLLIPEQTLSLVYSILICIFVQATLFWNGIITVYATSVQLGIRHRVIGVLCGFVPIAHLFALHNVIKHSSDEIKTETERAKRNSERAKEQICKTKYPLLMVHGVFFRDYKHLNYWGRIPKELELNGAEIYYGNHHSAASVEESAKELTERIRSIVDETGCEKVNVIAHSKGGLDCRYAVSFCDAAQYVASITTVNTPHRGCEFADHLLERIPEKVKLKVAKAYNAGARKLGDESPDFLAAVTDLTAAKCSELDAKMTAPEGIYCQSIGSKLNHASSGKFPLNFTYSIAKYFDGPNDGLVSEKSFGWGEDYQFLTVDGDRGISHGDMIDLYREDIKGFDVREFYVQLTAKLKNRGL